MKTNYDSQSAHFTFGDGIRAHSQVHHCNFDKIQSCTLRSAALQGKVTTPSERVRVPQGKR